MDKTKIETLKKYGFEFLTIFVGIFAAFTLDNWNENRKDHHTEIKILYEINRGLQQDMSDIDVNAAGHRAGLQAAVFFSQLILNKRSNSDSIGYHYFNLLRDFISVQNISGYQTLKSKGLEIIQNDSLRTKILSLYENDYNSLRKLEEDYAELQFFQHYQHDFSQLMVPDFMLDTNGKVGGISIPLNVTAAEKKILLIDLSRMAANRNFMIATYTEVKSKIMKLQQQIDAELKR